MNTFSVNNELSDSTGSNLNNSIIQLNRLMKFFNQHYSLDGIVPFTLLLLI